MEEPTLSAEERTRLLDMAKNGVLHLLAVRHERYDRDTASFQKQEITDEPKLGMEDKRLSKRLRTKDIKKHQLDANASRNSELRDPHPYYDARMTHEIVQEAIDALRAEKMLETHSPPRLTRTRDMQDEGEWQDPPEHPGNSSEITSLGLAAARRLGFIPDKSSKLFAAEQSTGAVKPGGVQPEAGITQRGK
jgi:hypothetical protein